MLEQFHNAILPPDARIAGYYLPGYSLWHEAQLQAMESPLLNALEEPVTGPDLLAALKVCESVHPVQAELRLSWRDWPALWVLSLSKKRLLSAVLVFTEWRLAHLVGPPMMEPVDSSAREGRALSAPAILSLVAYFVARGMAMSEAWALSPGFARHIQAAAAEFEGGAGFDDSDEFEFEHEEIEAMSEEEIEAQIRADLPRDRAEEVIRARRAGRREWPRGDADEDADGGEDW